MGKIRHLNPIKWGRSYQFNLIGFFPVQGSRFARNNSLKQCIFFLLHLFTLSLNSVISCILDSTLISFFLLEKTSFWKYGSEYFLFYSIILGRFFLQKGGSYSSSSRLCAKIQKVLTHRAEIFTCLLCVIDSSIHTKNVDSFDLFLNRHV